MKTIVYKRTFQLKPYESFVVEVTFDRNEGESTSAFMQRAKDQFNAAIENMGYVQKVQK